MTVSVVIPTWNGRPHLAKCLVSVTQQTTAPAEILIVDNGSSDDTKAWLAAQEPMIRVVRSPRNLGFAGGVNLGVQEALGDALWILNDDVVADSRCLEELLAGLAGQPDCAACSAKILRLGPDGPQTPAQYDAVGDYLTWTGFLFHLGFHEPDRGQYDHLQELFSPKGVSFVIRRAAFEAVGRFDAAFVSYFEESDLFWRLWLAGHRIRFSPSAIVWHEGGGTSRRLASEVIDRYAFRNRLQTLIQNLGTARLWLILPVHLALCVMISAAYVLRGQIRNAAAVLAAIGRTGLSLGPILAKRRHVQRVLRRVPDRELFRQHAWPIPLAWGWQFLGIYLKRW